MITYTIDDIEQSQANDIAVQVLDQMPYGIVIVSDKMKVILYNDQAEILFSKADGIAISQQYLVLNRWDTEHFRKRINQSQDQVEGAERNSTVALRVERNSGKVAYQLIARPLCRLPDDELPRNHGVWIVSIHDPEERAELPRSLLRDCFHMTDAEMDVCSQFFTSGSIDTVASVMGISRNTVKTHLQRIYSKCGVSSQSMLVMRLMFGLTH